MAINIKESLDINANKLKDLEKQINNVQTVSLISMLYGKDDSYKRILYHNDRINPSESIAFENYIEKKKMQRSAVSYLLTGYIFYSLTSYKRNWFKLTSRVSKTMFRGFLIFYFKFKLLLDKETEEIRFVQRNLEVIKSSVLEKIHEISDLPPEQNKAFMELMNTTELISKANEEIRNVNQELLQMNKSQNSNFSSNIV